MLAAGAAAPFAGGVSYAADVTSTWFGQTGNWSTPQLWSNSNGAIIYPNNGNLGLTYDAVVDLGNVALDQNITIDHLILNGSAGVTNNQFTLTLAKGGTWLGGSLTGTGTTVIGAGGTFNIGTDSSTSQFLTDQRLFNRGTINFGDSYANQSQSLVFLRTATITNQGTFNITADGHISADGTGTFNTSGTLVKSGSGIAVFDAPITFNNTGTVSVTGGALEILGSGTQSGAFNLVGTFVVGGAGTQQFNAGSSFTGTGGSVFFQDSTTVTIDGTYNVGRTVVRGQANVTFAGTNQSTSTMTIAGGTVNVQTALTANNLALTGGSLNILGQVFSQHVTLSGGSTTVGQPPITILARPVALGAVANTGGGPLLSTTTLTVVGGNNTCEPGATVAVGAGGVVFTGNVSPTLTLVSSPVAPGLLQLGGDVTFSGADGTCGIVNSGPVPIPGTIDLMAGQRSFTINDGLAAIDMQVSAQITNGSIRKDGAGVLQLSGASTYSGGTMLAGGVLEADNASALGSGPVTFAGGTLRLAVPSPATLPNALVAAPADSISLDVGAGSYQFGQLTLGAALNVAGTGSITFTGPITLPASPVGPLTINSTANVTLAGPISGGAGIIELPGGTLTLGGTSANTYSGATQVLGGNLILSKPAETVAVPGDLAIVGASTVTLNASDQIAANSNVSFNTTGGSPRLNLNGQNQTVGMISSIQAGAGTIQLGSGTLTVGGSGVVGTFSGSLQGTGRLTKSGTGTLVLGAANTFGGLTVGGGILQLGADQHVNSLISTGGQLDVRGSQLFDTYPLILFPPISLDPAQAIRADLQAGTITSSLNTATTRVGLGDSADGAVAGLPAHSLLLRRARLGDVNMDGVVDFNDLLLLTQHYGQTGRIWDQGDMNYDGSVNFADLLSLAQNYGGTLSAAEASSPAIAPVPEPGILAVGVLWGVLLLPRRRKLC